MNLKQLLDTSTVEQRELRRLIIRREDQLQQVRSDLYHLKIAEPKVKPPAPSVLAKSGALSTKMMQVLLRQRDMRQVRQMLRQAPIRQ